MYGASFVANWDVPHVRVESPEKIQLLMGCKYVFSSFKDSISQVKQDLSNGRKVLFSGTSCKVAAIYKICGSNPNITLVEVICHGAPKPEYWNGKEFF